MWTLVYGDKVYTNIRGGSPIFWEFPSYLYIYVSRYGFVAICPKKWDHSRLDVKGRLFQRAVVSAENW